MAESIYSRNQIEQWGRNLKELKQQPRTDFNKKQAVEALMDIIEDTLESRSYREVAGGLSKWGLEISEGSLKKYVSTYRREHSAGNSEGNNKKIKKRAGSRRNRSTRQNIQKEKEKITTSKQISGRGLVDSNSDAERASSKTQRLLEEKTEVSTPKRSGKGRLKSDDSSHRYPGEQGKPIEMNINYD